MHERLSKLIGRGRSEAAAYRERREAFINNPDYYPRFEKSVKIIEGEFRVIEPTKPEELNAGQQEL